MKLQDAMGAWTDLRRHIIRIISLRIASFLVFLTHCLNTGFLSRFSFEPLLV